MTLPLFDRDENEPEHRPEFAQRLGPRLHALAREGIYFGTSSWKYEGWLGQIYSPERYSTRGKFSKKKFEAECLREYAETFPAVGGDFSFYQFPSRDYWERLFGNAPETLRFGLKVPEEITVPTWPGHARYGKRAGQENEAFLDPQVFERFFAGPLGPYRERVGVMMFEFGTFAKKTFGDVTQFIDRLEPFLEKLPAGFRYGVEIRNPDYLGAAYFSCLKRHNTAHVFNAWTRMPALGDQIDFPDAWTADFAVVRALLTRGRSYEQAVQKFQPYKDVQEPNASARVAMREIAELCRLRKLPAYLFVNNRLEGNAPETIEAVVADL